MTRPTTPDGWTTTPADVGWHWLAKRGVTSPQVVLVVREWAVMRFLEIDREGSRRCSSIKSAMWKPIPEEAVPNARP